MINTVLKNLTIVLIHAPVCGRILTGVFVIERYRDFIIGIDF